MESEKNWWSRVKEKFTNRIFVAFLAVFFLLVTFVFLFIQNSGSKTDFYPRSKHNLVERVIKMFIEQEYLNLTSYVDRISSGLPASEQKIVLFYKAESYFKQKKLSEANKIFLALDKSHVDFWQAKFRMGCISLLLGNKEQAKRIMQEIDKPVEEVYFWKGLLFYELGEFEEALSLMKKVYYKPDAILITANIYMQQKSEREALEHYLILKNKYPAYREKALNAIMNIYDKSKNYMEYLKVIEEYEHLFPHRIDIKRKKGWILYQLGRKGEAFQLLSSETLAKKDVETFQLLSKIAFEMERYQEAAYYYSQYKLSAIERSFYVQALMKTHQYTRAMEEIKTYLGESEGEVKNLVWGYYQLVECNMQLGELENALQVTNKLLALEKTADNYILLARIFKNMGNKAGYFASLKQATDYEPKYIPVLLENMLQARNYHEVDLITEKILKKDAYNEFALYYRAKQKFKEKMYDQAKILLYTLIYLPPTDQKRAEDSYYMLGTILMQAGQLQEAEGFFQKVLQLNPSSLKSTLKLTIIQIKNGEKEKAKEILLRTKNKSQLPGNVLSVIYAYLGYIEMQEGHYEKARYYIDRALELNRNNQIAKSVLQKLE